MEEEKMEILQPLFTFLKLQGIWPKSTKNLDNKTMILLRVILVIISYSIGMISCSFHVVHTLKNGPPYPIPDLIEDCAILSAGFGFYYMMLVFMNNSRTVYNLVITLSNFKEFGRPLDADDVNKKLNWFTRAFYAYSWLGGLNYGLVQLYEKEKCVARNVNYVEHKVCGLMVPTWMPFDLHAPSRFYLFLSLQILICTLFCNTASLMYSFMVAVIEMFLIRVRHFKQNISLTFTIEDSHMSKMHLKNCIKYHIHIIELGNEIDVLLGKFSLMNMTFMPVIISLIGLQIMLQPTMGCFMHLFAWLFILLITCIAGERLIMETSKLPFHIYGLEWTKGDNEMQKCILFMIARANQHIEIQVSGYGNLSMETFTNIIKLAYSYLTMFRQSTME